MAELEKREPRRSVKTEEAVTEETTAAETLHENVSDDTQSEKPRQTQKQVRKIRKLRLRRKKMNPVSQKNYWRVP